MAEYEAKSATNYELGRGLIVQRLRYSSRLDQSKVIVADLASNDPILNLIGQLKQSYLTNQKIYDTLAVLSLSTQLSPGEVAVSKKCTA